MGRTEKGREEMEQRIGELSLEEAGVLAVAPPSLIHYSGLCLQSNKCVLKADVQQVPLWFKCTIVGL